jgi:CO dehydrogenase maturation factor
MKIAVSGKGGVGKTFVAASLAAYFVRSGHAVIAIDADPAPNLALSLGFTPEEAEKIVPIAENTDLIKLKTGTDFGGVFRLTFSVEDIIQDYAIRTPSGASLMVMGTVRSMGSGCVCPAHTVIKALLRHLVVERDEVVILDMDAGIEHLGRGTADHVDVLLVVTDANRKSLEIAGSICRLAGDSDIRQVGLVANRIASDREESVVREFAERNNIPFFAFIPYDRQVADAGIFSSPIDPGTSVAGLAIDKLAKKLVETEEEI